MAQLDLESVLRHVPRHLRASAEYPYRGRPPGELDDIFQQLTQLTTRSNHMSIVNKIPANIAELKLQKYEVFLYGCLGLTNEEVTVKGEPGKFEFVNVKTQDKSRSLKDFLRNNASKLLASETVEVSQHEGGKYDQYLYY